MTLKDNENIIDFDAAHHPTTLAKDMLHKSKLPGVRSGFCVLTAKNPESGEEEVWSGNCGMDSFEVAYALMKQLMLTMLEDDMIKEKLINLTME